MIHRKQTQVAQGGRSRGAQLARAIAALAGAAAVACAQAAGISGDPGGYVPAPAGTDLGLVYYQHLTADDVYAGNRKVASNLGLTLDLALLRYVRFIKIGDWLADPQVLVPVARQKIGLSDQKFSGIGDVVAGGTVWPLYDWEANHHLGFSFFTSLPTGAHKGEGFAPSINRYAYNVQVGYVRGITKKLALEGSAQAEFYGSERDTGSNKKTYYQLDGAINYQLDDTSLLGVTYRHGWGGRDALGQNVFVANEKRDTVILTWAKFFTPKFQLQLQWRQDVKVPDGSKIQGLQTRFLYLM